MKRITLLASLLVGSFCLHAQYESFFGKNNWSYNIAYYETCYTDEYDPTLLGPCVFTSTFSFSKENTTLTDSTCYYVGNTGDIFLREDTADGKLYAYYSSFGQEFLLCDMSLNPGDTFSLNLPYEYGNGIVFNSQMLVDSVTIIGGKKSVHLSLLSGDVFNHFFHQEYNINLRFIEGVGPMYGVYYLMPDPMVGMLLCVHKDDTLSFMTHENLGCTQNCSSVKDYPSSFIEIRPNPASEHLSITFDQDHVEGFVFLRDVTGRIVCSNHINGNPVFLPIHNIPKGLYLITYMDNQGRKITKKVIIH